jgi:hypothetical protein
MSCRRSLTKASLSRLLDLEEPQQLSGISVSVADICRIAVMYVLTNPGIPIQSC